MKKAATALILSLILILTSCDLFMPYEKPDLYVITIGLGYNYKFPYSDTNAALPNTRNDADCFEDLMTGLADQAGMDWYSVAYRDEYPYLTAEQEMMKKLSSIGNAVITLNSSDPSVNRTFRERFDMLVTKPNESLYLREKMEEMLFSTPGVKKPTENDILIFYYAGHGAKNTGHLWIVPPVLLKQTPGKENRECYWMLDDLTASDGLLMNFPGRRAVVLDSCFSGNIIEGNRNDLGMGEMGGNDAFVPGHGNNPYEPGWWDRDRNREERVQVAGGVPENDERSLIPDIFLVTSASKSQPAADGEDSSNSPFMEAFISFVQPGFIHGDFVKTARKRIYLSDIYKVAKKAMLYTTQDPQTLLTRYDLTLFDFTR